MNSFKIGIANKTIEINTIYALPYAICRRYFVEGKPDFCIQDTQKEIEQLQAEFEEKFSLTATWGGKIETMLVFRKVVEGLIDYNIFVLHGAAIAVDGKAIIFIGRSGIGKTTHIRKWLKNLPNAYVVNGDKPFIAMDGTPMVCGSPWAGKENMSTNTMVPLKAIVFLERSEDNNIKKISFMEAFPMLLQQTHRPTNAEKMRKTLQLLKALDGKVSFYKFQLNNFKEDCFQVAKEALIENIT